VEASALPTRLTAGRAPLSAAFLRLRSDEQLVALFRGGSDDAFRAIHDRYGARLLAYTRQMLRGGGDPEDALQDVFIRAYRSLRSSDRPVTLRAWLYRIAHNRCIDELRRPHPLPSELAADAEPAFGGPAASREPPAVAERSAALARLVADVRTLPSQQRSALLMRELQGLSYDELASAMAISVPAVKSLLLRARTGMIEISAARDTPCAEIRDELIRAADRRVRVGGRARRHCGECASCEAYRGELKRVSRGFASLTPSGPLAQLGLLLGFGGGGGSGGGSAAAAGGSAAAAGGGAAASAGGGAAAGGGVLAGLTATKVAVAVCCAALLTTAGRAVIAPSTQAPARAATQSSATTGDGAGVLAPNRLIGVPTAVSDATGGSPAGQGAALGNGGEAAAATGPVNATGATGSTGAVGGTAYDPSGTTGAFGPPAGSTGATGMTGTSPVSGIGGPASAVATGGYANPAAPAGSTGATGTSGSTLTSDQHGGGGTSASPTGSSGAIGASATIAAAPGSAAGG
jgi:RNA polymerase sigma factor (sigma-70 family)